MASEILNEILSTLLVHAQQLLRKNGEFFPFGATAAPNAQPVLIAAMPKNTERPASQDVINALSSAMKQKVSEGSIEACGICLDSLFTPEPGAAKQDAICCNLESAAGESVTVYMPYTKRKKLLSRQVEWTFGDLIASPKEPIIFNE